MDCRDSEGTDIKESESQRRNLKDRSANIDDTTRGASNLGDCATNKNNTVPSHLQDHDDKSDKSNRDKIILDNIYIDVCSFSATTEDELREIKAFCQTFCMQMGSLPRQLYARIREINLNFHPLASLTQPVY